MKNKRVNDIPIKLNEKYDDTKTLVKLRDENPEKPYIEFMENKKGENIARIKKDAPSPSFLTGLLTILLIASFILIPKTYSITENIIIDGSILVYPFTFLILTFMCKRYSFKQIRKSIYLSSILYLVFMFFICLGINPPANSDTSNYNLVIQFIFAGNSKEFGEATLFYPMIGQTFGIVIAYFVSHLIYALIFFILKDITIDYLSALLGLFIAYIIDRTIFSPIYCNDFVFGTKPEFDYFIKFLAGEYLFAIFIIIIILLIYSLFGGFVKTSKQSS